MSKTAVLSGDSWGAYSFVETEEYDGTLAEYLAECASAGSAIEACPDDDCPVTHNTDGATILRIAHHNGGEDQNEDWFSYTAFWGEDADERQYYVIFSRYVGPNADDRDANAHGNRDYYTIQREPGTTNMSGEELTEGWLGTTNDWSETACGEFATEAEARESIEEDVREWREGSGLPEPEDGKIVLVVANTESGALYEVDWDADDLDIQLVEGVEWLFADDPGNSERSPEWKALEALLWEARDTGLHGDEKFKLIIDALEELGWVVEELENLQWDHHSVVGRPGARVGDPAWQAWREKHAIGSLTEWNGLDSDDAIKWLAEHGTAAALEPLRTFLLEDGVDDGEEYDTADEEAARAAIARITARGAN